MYLKQFHITTRFIAYRILLIILSKTMDEGLLSYLLLWPSDKIILSRASLQYFMISASNAGGHGLTFDNFFLG